MKRSRMSTGRKCAVAFQIERAYGIAFGLLMLLFSGCGQSDVQKPSLIPVSGLVSLDGRPATSGGGVSYRDESGLVQPSGVVGKDGVYHLSLDGRVGAPPGKYRVLVSLSEPQIDAAGKPGLPRIIVDEKFMKPGSTPLIVEVKTDNVPGAYDLHVTRKK